MQNKVNIMPDKTFWEVIDLIQLDADEPLEEAMEKLLSFSEEQIEQFEETLSRKLYNLDTKKHADGMSKSVIDGEEYFSPDFFLYVRCLCVAKGKEFYEACLKDPSLMQGIDYEYEFEELLELASEAYEEKTGHEMDYIPYFDYETYSNEKGWE
ncbi:DUF4240 domain-containing protein [Aciduricibacillus chroicocephali]|uniref:DUF4240 domain-containing protein n=1 Tax=Aciduricibacillus chroicocephali TaxID=3054939 RepID=A0ABY9KTG3_9BACI|nr:DUF4240 domain-containing protein [Bacillaceae bacterium 44XB]